MGASKRAALVRSWRSMRVSFECSAGRVFSADSFVNSLRYLIGRGRVNQNEGGSTKIENQPYSYSVYTLHCTVHTLLQESLLLPSYCIWLCICSVSEVGANTWRITIYIYMLRAIHCIIIMQGLRRLRALFCYCFLLFCFSVRSATRRLPRFQGMKIHRFTSVLFVIVYL